jgi:succinate dehydrogenase/fumarate reductase flavoprotein subunit
MLPRDRQRAVTDRVPSPTSDQYDFVTIGAGSAAFAAAIRASNLGGRVALVERETVGGTCVNVGRLWWAHLRPDAAQAGGQGNDGESERPGGR